MSMKKRISMVAIVLPLVVSSMADGSLSARYLNGSDLLVPVATAATVSKGSGFSLGTIGQGQIPDGKEFDVRESSRSLATPLVLAARNDDRECYWLGTCGN